MAAEFDTKQGEMFAALLVTNVDVLSTVIGTEGERSHYCDGLRGPREET